MCVVLPHQETRRSHDGFGTAAAPRHTAVAEAARSQGPGRGLEGPLPGAAQGARGQEPACGGPRDRRCALHGGSHRRAISGSGGSLDLRRPLGQRHPQDRRGSAFRHLRLVELQPAARWLPASPLDAGSAGPGDPAGVGPGGLDGTPGEDPPAGARPLGATPPGGGLSLEGRQAQGSAGVPAAAGVAPSPWRSARVRRRGGPPLEPQDRSGRDASRHAASDRDPGVRTSSATWPAPTTRCTRGWSTPRATRRPAGCS